MRTPPVKEAAVEASGHRARSTLNAHFALFSFGKGRPLNKPSTPPPLRLPSVADS